MENKGYTIIILTKNESEIIEKCLQSLPKGIDYIVLDSGSIDDTKKIVENNNVAFYEHQISPFVISDQRNWALKHLPIKTEWVLFLDADEFISEKLHMEILTRIKDKNYNAYRMTPKFIFWGKWMKRLQGYPNWHDRLLKKDEVRIVGGVWEKFDENAKVGFIDIPYEHYANCKGFESWLEKHNRYSSWDAKNTYAYLYQGEKLNEVRKVKLRKISSKIWWLKPWIRCFYMYFVRLGFLEGWRAFYLVMLYFIYEYMTVFKIIELKRINNGKTL